uniref:Uncharacterized protein n=1 Tax=Pinctada fucata TaxID=50426 RepID=A0A194AP56_PINFU
MISTIIYVICLSLALSDAITIDTKSAVFYQDVHNHFLVLKDNSSCYFWQLKDNDVSAFYRPSSQRDMENHFLNELKTNPQLTPYSPNKMAVSFVIVSRCPKSYMVPVSEYSTTK